MKTLLAALGLLACTGCVNDADVSKIHVPYHTAIAMSPTANLRVTQSTGTIRVIAWNEPRVQIDADRYGTSADIASAVKIVAERTPDGIRIRAENENNVGFNKRVGVDFIIHAPASAALQLETTAGVIEVTGFSSDVAANLTAGEIGITMAKFAAPQRVSANLTTGEVRVRLPKGGAAAVSMSVLLGEKTNKYVSAGGVSPGTVDAHATLGEVLVEPGVM
jgi:hypothetical protein